MDDDIWRSRCRRYAQARAVMTSRQVEMRTRSRRETAATAVRLCTPPGKRRVLSVVLTRVVIPRQAQNLYVTAGRTSEGEAIRGRMAGVVETDGFGRVGVDPHHPLSGHVDEGSRLDGPLHTATVETDRHRFHA